MKNFITDRRKAANLSQRELAAMLSVHYQALQRWERGDVLPSIEVALRLADALHCKVEELFVLES